MASVVQSGLYPPIIDNYIPAINVGNFVNAGISDTAITIYFYCSDYNDPDDIKAIHVSITNQSDYKSLFDHDRYPMGIALYTKIQAADKGEGWYKITIPKGHLTNSLFEYNLYYKIQLRFDKSSDGLAYTGTQLSNYLVNEGNLTNFSEWSKVGLTRFIAPRISEIQVNGASYLGKEPVMLNVRTDITLSGKWMPTPYDDVPASYTKIQDCLQDKEYISSYRVRVTKDGEEIFKSKELHPSSLGLNEVNYNIPYTFDNNTTYVLYLDLVTANLYEETLSTQITTEQETAPWDNTYLMETTSVDTVVGKTSIIFEPGSVPAALEDGTLTIKRASHLDNFSHWDTMYSTHISNNTTFPITYTDSTIESGTIYKYKLIYNCIINHDVRKIMTIIEGDVLSIFDHAFLTGEHTQLPVKFNPNISSFRYNRADNIVTTIGSQYPYITRNANTNYRTFSLSGTIAYEMDIQKDFATREDIYGGYVDIFGTYFVNHYINDRNDKITQREFRELVMSFLYSDKPKIFRSTPEGNVLVRLTDISLTPNQQIGRMIYDFNCTATEIGECSVENYKLYDIQDFGDL